MRECDFEDKIHVSAVKIYLQMKANYLLFACMSFYLLIFFLAWQSILILESSCRYEKLVETKLFFFASILKDNCECTDAYVSYMHER